MRTRNHALVHSYTSSSFTVKIPLKMSIGSITSQTATDIPILLDGATLTAKPSPEQLPPTSPCPGVKLACQFDVGHRRARRINADDWTALYELVAVKRIGR